MLLRKGRPPQSVYLALSNLEPVRIMVVDDHPVMRNSLRHLLKASIKWKVYAEAEQSVKDLGRTGPIAGATYTSAPRKMHQQACKSQILMCSLRVTRSSALTGSSTTFTANTRARLPGINDLV